jgi:hypothetical protein
MYIYVAVGFTGTLVVYYGTRSGPRGDADASERAEPASDRVYPSESRYRREATSLTIQSMPSTSPSPSTCTPGDSLSQCTALTGRHCRLPPHYLSERTQYPLRANHAHTDAQCTRGHSRRQCPFAVLSVCSAPSVDVLTAEQGCTFQARPARSPSLSASSISLAASAPGIS